MSRYGNNAIFAPVKSQQEAVAILTSFTEDDLLKYTTETRLQLIDELETICVEGDIKEPLWLAHARNKQDVYEERAELLGIQPRTFLEIVNEDFGTDFKNMDAFRKAIAAYDFVNNS